MRAVERHDKAFSSSVNEVPDERWMSAEGAGKRGFDCGDELR
jgi:hypothetical protein